MMQQSRQTKANTGCVAEVELLPIGDGVPEQLLPVPLLNSAMQEAAEMG